MAAAANIQLREEKAAGCQKKKRLDDAKEALTKAHWGSDAEFYQAMGNAQALEDAYELQCKEAAAVEKHAYDLEARRYVRERDARYREIGEADAQQQKMAEVAG